jgi:hypothetical protein
MDKELTLIIERFPGNRAQILTLYFRNEDFRQLCSDYLLSLHSIEELNADPLTDKEIEHDFEVVSKDLEKELLRVLGSQELEN